jgi:tetratricopeptide (TPR) repeat protein
MNRIEALGICILSLLCVGGAGVVGPSSIADQLESYAHWLTAGGDPPQFTAGDLDAARTELGRIAPNFLQGDSQSPAPAVYERQRRILVTFALELAATGSRKQAGAAAQLVEWGCGYVRSHEPLNDFDRAWQLAALAVLEGGIDGRTLQAHLAHVQNFLPEPRLLLARGIADEQSIAPSEVIHAAPGTSAQVAQVLAGAEAEHARAADRAVAHFRDAAKNDAVRAEAALRLGHVQYALHHDDLALASWSSVEQDTSDIALKYLVRLFRGLAYEGLGRNADARDAYVGALALSPNAHSAAVRLAALEFRTGRTDDSTRLLGGLLQNDDPRRDPWWSYYAADWRFWYARIERVRGLAKQ